MEENLFIKLSGFSNTLINIFIILTICFMGRQDLTCSGLRKSCSLEGIVSKQILIRRRGDATIQ
jgi:hypothetical protein